MPDWLVVLMACIFVGSLVWIVADRVSARRRTKIWTRDVAAHADAMSPGELAERIADGLGLDPEAFRTVRFERLAAAADRAGHTLPFIWIDAEAASLLLGVRPSQRMRYALKASWAVGLPMAWPMFGTFVAISVPLAIGALLAGVEHALIVALVTGALVLSIGATLLLAWFRASGRSLGIVSDRATLFRRQRAVSEVEPGSAHVVIARIRIRGRNGYIPTDHLRWWFIARGQPAMFADDLSPRNTPWAAEIINAIACGVVHQKDASVCEQCGYPREGLRDRVCPECGHGLDEPPEHA